MVESINTNTGALAAIRALVSARGGTQQAENRVATGLRVLGARDNASAFSIAEGVRAELKGLQAVQQGIDNARGLAGVATAGATQVSSLLSDLRAVAVSALNPANTPEQSAILSGEFQALTDQIGQTIQNSGFNGTNLLTQGAADQQVLSDTTGGTLSISAQDLETGVVGVVNSADLSAAVSAVQSGDSTAASTFLANLDTAIGNANGALGALGADSRALDSQSTFLDAINIASEEVLGSIVDADLGRQSVALAAGQVQQQLALTSLSIANSQPQVLTGLFNTA